MLNVHNWYYFLHYLYRIIGNHVYIGAGAKIVKSEIRMQDYV